MENLERKINLLIDLALAEDSKSRDAIKEALSSEQKAAQPVLSVLSKGRDVRTVVESVLRQIGVPCNLKGHRCLVSALCRTVNDPDIIYQITKVLYPLVAQDCDTTVSRTERAIRHAVEVAFDRGDLEALSQYFGGTISPSKGKPTNAEFISQVANHIRRHFDM